ncbi:hypothetical protein TNCV_2947021 [Trichonephila clavipes]|nr:hypothetical protein TNCV_2947021 [Trichonephila clavipes]
MFRLFHACCRRINLFCGRQRNMSSSNTRCSGSFRAKARVNLNVSSAWPAQRSPDLNPTENVCGCFGEAKVARLKPHPPSKQVETPSHPCTHRGMGYAPQTAAGVDDSASMCTARGTLHSHSTVDTSRY